MLDLSSIKLCRLRYIILFQLMIATILTLLVYTIYDNSTINNILGSFGHIINLNLVSSWILMLGTIYLVIIKISDLTWSDIGFTNVKPKIIIATVTYFMIWLLMELSTLLYLQINDLPIRFATDWKDLGLTVVLGIIIGHLFGNTPLEEISYRAFMFPQLYKLFEKKGIRNQYITYILSILISQLIFALLHIPIRLFNNDPIDFVSISFLFTFGCFLVLVYYRTDNLFLTIAIHSFLNYRNSVLDTQGFDTSLVFFVFTILLLFVYPYLIDTSYNNRLDEN